MFLFVAARPQGSAIAGTGLLGPPVVPFYRFFFWEKFPAKTDYRKKGTLILTCLLEDLGYLQDAKGLCSIKTCRGFPHFCFQALELHVELAEALVSHDGGVC